MMDNQYKFTSTGFITALMTQQVIAKRGFKVTTHASNITRRQRTITVTFETKEDGLAYVLRYGTKVAAINFVDFVMNT